jgi:uncharacterized protein
MPELPRWSRYNRLFRASASTPGSGGYLYNTLSNCLFELDDEHYGLLESLERQSGRESGRASPPALETARAAEMDREREALREALRMAAAFGTFMDTLRDRKVLVAADEEDDELLVRRHRARAARFDVPGLALCICPTMACNFRCSYCFQSSQGETARMSPETMDRLLDFIGGYGRGRSLRVAWYGGEPLLAFDAIVELTARFRSADPAYGGAELVTNGYLLDAPKIALLNDLGIVAIQITLDGPEATQDRRRVLAGGAPTFGRIMDKLGALMDSDYRGSCKVRVNVDKDNQDDFPLLRTALLERFAGKRLRVYAARVSGNPDARRDRDCGFHGEDWAEYSLRLYRESGIHPAGGFHPAAKADNLCTATSERSFVVGPSGELYKCWKDAGRPDMVVGNVHARPALTNPALLARYAIGADAWDDPACRTCEMFPICGGGCANERLEAKYSGGRGLERCSVYRTHLTAYLEAYIDIMRTKEICAALLAPGNSIAPGARPGSGSGETGWRIISPASPSKKEKTHVESIPESPLKSHI